MTAPSSRRRLLAATIVLCCGPVLVVPAARATAPFDASALSGGGSPTVSSGCGEHREGTVGVTQSPVANGPAGVVAVSSTENATNPMNPNDYVTSAARVSTSAALHTSGADPSSIDVAMTGTSASTSGIPSPSCTATADSLVELDTTVTLTHPMVLTLDGSNAGHGSFEVQVIPAGGTPTGPGTLSLIGYGRSSLTHYTAFLASGQYTFSIVTESQYAAHATAPTSSDTASVRIGFAVAGSRTTAHNSAYVTMATSRTCGSHRVSPRITTSRKNAKKIVSVAFLVNGKRVALLKHPAAGRVVNLPAPDNVPIAVVAKAKVRKTNGTKATVASSASYLQCS